MTTSDLPGPCCHFQELGRPTVGGDLQNEIKCVGLAVALDHEFSVLFFGSRPRSIIRADPSAPAVAPIAAGTAINAYAAPPASATPASTTPAPAAAAESAATETTAPAATAASRLCCCGRRADQDGRRTHEVNEHQSYRCNAARNDIVAFGHLNLPVTSSLETGHRVNERCYLWLVQGFAKICGRSKVLAGFEILLGGPGQVKLHCQVRTLCNAP
jgi:hypothetical protein